LFRTIGTIWKFQSLKTENSLQNFWKSSLKISIFKILWDKIFRNFSANLKFAWSEIFKFLRLILGYEVPGRLGFLCKFDSARKTGLRVYFRVFVMSNVILNFSKISFFGFFRNKVWNQPYQLRNSQIWIWCSKIVGTNLIYKRNKLTSQCQGT